MSSDVIGSNFRSGTVAALVTLTVMGLGSAFKITGNTPNGFKQGGSGSILQIWANSGASVGKLNSSGALVMSGANLIINHRNTTTTGGLIVEGKGFHICFFNASGVQKEIVETGGQLRTRIPVGIGCSPQDRN
jgi:hypothetical protein